MGICFSSALHTGDPTPARSSRSNNATVSRLAGEERGLEEGLSNGCILDAPNLRIFTLAELRKATENFSPASLIGEGGFGRVYRGWVDERTLEPTTRGTGMAIAVKRLDSTSWQGLEQLKSEVNFLGRISHPNLVKLLGYCMEDRARLLVYEFLPNGSLEVHLFKRTATFEPLSWDLRLKIALGAARGLAFLHHSRVKVIHRDLKPSNVLLDTSHNPKISDFGLAKQGPIGDETHVSTRTVGGTVGYLDPEYIMTGHLYVSSDVYSFGVVLVELLSGQRVIDRSRKYYRLLDWAKPLLTDRRKLSQLMDPRLEGEWPAKGAFLAAKLASRCIATDSRSRPSMQEVVQILEHIEALANRPQTSTDQPL